MRAPSSSCRPRLSRGKERQAAAKREQSPEERTPSGLFMLERAMGIEPTIPSLGSWCWTTQLRPLGTSYITP